MIVVTNQSGIARGLLTEQDYERVRMRVDKLIADFVGSDYTFKELVIALVTNDGYRYASPPAQAKEVTP